MSLASRISLPMYQNPLLPPFIGPHPFLYRQDRRSSHKSRRENISTSNLVWWGHLTSAQQPLQTGAVAVR